MMMGKLPADLQPLVAPAGFVVALLVLAMIRIWFLRRSNERLFIQHERMERQVLNQQRDIIGLRQDSNAWRGAMQMQFDAFRAESSRRVEDSEMRYDQAMKQQETHIAYLQNLLSKTLEPAVPPASPAALPGAVSSVLEDIVVPVIDEQSAVTGPLG